MTVLLVAVDVNLLAVAVGNCQCLVLAGQTSFEDSDMSAVEGFLYVYLQAGYHKQLVAAVLVAVCAFAYNFLAH